ncbi:Cof-type HAD-IIB family hydrolase [Caldisalinibacter kiritimatiensis]|uniref:Hydrolase (HAD superfamily) n=1 Tax=Caldisalinibacter kiritimatiensis TaxID=1304284 RepID=R1AWT4_9FIRM|nr:Cof-type HAD-IIB family hydrolase [Caldisalinibacter kiritimatiensis]EOD01102.1 Hydrolase (HAD superfamily) [Caldisalinibacter kiritimatiensis]
MYKLVAIDMDGTLLNKEHKISKENFKAIQEAIDAGVKVVLASGRIFGGLRPYLEELNLINDDNYCVSCAGGLVVNNTMSKIIQNYSLGMEELKYIYKLANELNLSVNVYTRDKIVAFQDDAFSQLESIANRVPVEIKDFDSLQDIEAYKVTIINDSAKALKKIKVFFEEFIDIDEKYLKNAKILEENVLDTVTTRLSDKYTVVKPFEFTLEVINKNCNKWTGVKRIADQLGIKQEEIICIGDSENDEHMIRNAGLGVAMANGFSKMKKIADYVTYTNDQHGVAHVINKFILEKDLAYAE